MPVLGTGMQHDWGVIALDLGCEVVDFTAILAMGLRQSLALDSNLIVTLNFSDEVLINGAPTLVFTGILDTHPRLFCLPTASRSRRNSWC